MDSEKYLESRGWKMEGRRWVDPTGFYHPTPMIEVAVSAQRERDAERLDAVLASPCPHIKQSPEGTSYCRLAEDAVRGLQAENARLLTAASAVKSAAVAVARDEQARFEELHSKASTTVYALTCEAARNEAHHIATLIDALDVAKIGKGEE